MTQDTSTVLSNAKRPDDIPAPTRRAPAESGIWVFILLDMLVFAEMFGIFTWYRAENRELFRSSQHAVNPLYGLVYTLLLLTSSWFVVMAVSAVRKRQFDTAAKFVMWGFAGGAAFVVIKFIEYGSKLSNGITPVTNDFYMFYFVMTFVHLLHASVGLGVLVYVRNQIRALEQLPSLAPPDRLQMRTIEAGAIYWHMVDLLWIVLFALFYLRG